MACSPTFQTSDAAASRVHTVAVPAMLHVYVLCCVLALILLIAKAMKSSACLRDKLARFGEDSFGLPYVSETPLHSRPQPTHTLSEFYWVCMAPFRMRCCARWRDSRETDIEKGA